MICGDYAVPLMLSPHLIWIPEYARVRAAGGTAYVHLPCLESVPRPHESDTAHRPHGGCRDCGIPE